MRLQSIKHIVAGGCSQSVDGIGGIPPIPGLSNGGCSFTNADTKSVPGSWISYVAQELNVDSLCNTAANSHGNILISNCLIDVLTKYAYPSQETLVLFNLTWLTRLDIPCAFDHFDRSCYIPWDQSILPHTYLGQSSRTLLGFYEHIGKQQVIDQSRRAVFSLFDFLRNQGFCYRFVLASDDIFGDASWQTFLMHHQDSLVRLGSQIGVKNFVHHHGLTRDKMHPTQEGHARIARIVLDSL